MQPPPLPPTHTHMYLVECLHKPVNIHGDLSLLKLIPSHSLLATPPVQLGTGRVWHKPMATRTEGERCPLQEHGEQWWHSTLSTYVLHLLSLYQQLQYCLCTVVSTITSHKKFSERKQAHVGMEASKTNQTRWEWHHNTFTPPLHLVPFCRHLYVCYLCAEKGCGRQWGG